MCLFVTSKMRAKALASALASTAAPGGPSVSPKGRLGGSSEAGDDEHGFTLADHLGQAACGQRGKWFAMVSAASFIHPYDESWGKSTSYRADLNGHQPVKALPEHDSHFSPSKPSSRR